MVIPEMDQPKQTIPGVVAPPPVIFLVALAAGLILDAMYPLLLASIGTIGKIAGGILIAAGLSLSFAVTRHFQRARTPVSALRPSRHLVISGPYRYSRNPDYLGQTLTYCGIILMFNSLWLLLTLFPALFLVRYGVVAREERYLENLFGEEYRRYRQHVRRWL